MTRKLHIGGEICADGWEVLNINPGKHVDHVCNATNMSIFQDNTFDEIYASHIVEHLDYVHVLDSTLKEWRRVLKPGGKISISVPNLDFLAGLLLAKNRTSPEQRFFVMRMMFGGHIDKYDYHLVGLNEEILTAYLLAANYENIKRVDEFGLFEDLSTMKIEGTYISLNMTAGKRL